MDWFSAIRTTSRCVSSSLPCDVSRGAYRAEHARSPARCSPGSADRNLGLRPAAGDKQIQPCRNGHKSISHPAAPGIRGEKTLVWDHRHSKCPVGSRPVARPYLRAAHDKAAHDRIQRAHDRSRGRQRACDWLLGGRRSRTLREVRERRRRSGDCHPRREAAAA